MRRVLKLGAVAAAALAVAVLAQPSSPTSPVGVRAQVGQRVEYRRPPPSCAQAIKDLGLEGQPVSCEDPPAPTYDPPQMHGQYRLYPGSYVGTLTYEDGPDTAPPGVVSDDVDIIKASSMYVEPAWLPDGYTLSSINTNDYDSEHVIVAIYTGPGQPININHVRRSEWPVDIIQPAGDSPVVYETPVLDGVPAVLSYPKAGSPPQVRETVLRFAQGDVETIIFGDDLGPETATQIALSLICGASCVSPPAPAATAVNVGPPNTTSVASQQGDVSAPDTGTSLDSTAAVVQTEHRVIAGLAINPPQVQASYWPPDPYYGYWHGWRQTSPEAALDLTVPGDPGPPNSWTAGQPVYVMTWAWSGAGVLSFYTTDYSRSTSCTGRYVELDEPAIRVLGTLAYVHLESEQPENDSWTSNASGWTIHPLGYVAHLQPDQPPKTPCPFTGPHLHQGVILPRRDDPTESGPIVYNRALALPGGLINPTNDPVGKWMFRVPIIPYDSDGDGCSDQEELGSNPVLGGQRDPHNPWDFFDVPMPVGAPGTGTRDQQVDGNDALYVLSKFGASPGDPYPTAPKYDQAYDRSAPSPNAWNTHAPNGVQDGNDVLYSLWQFGHSCFPPP